MLFFSSGYDAAVALLMFRPKPEVATAAAVRRAARRVRMVEVRPKRKANHGRIAPFFTM